MSAVTEARDRVRSVLATQLPQLSEDQIAALEVGAWNWALGQCDLRGNVRVFDHAMCDDYLRRAAHCTANMSAGPLGNGNTWLLPLVLAGSVEPYDVAFMDASSLNAPLSREFADAKNRRNLHDRDEYLAVSTMFECPKCAQRRSTYRQLQTRSGDEGSTMFVHCLACGHDWTDLD